MKFLRWLSQKDRVIRLLKEDNRKLSMELAVMRIEKRLAEQGGSK